jgi:hypothetical protein
VKFVYLIQSEGDISDEMKSLNDVFLLSWKTPINDAIFYPNSTWTEGRNKLYEEVKNLDYDYFIFIDDDIIVSDFKKFEVLLEKYKPVIGLPLFTNWVRFNNKSEGDISTMYSFDACCNAIRKDAFDVLLPYDDREDSESWFYSQLYFVHKARIIYPAQIAHFNDVHMKNPIHRNYPNQRNFKDKDKIFKSTIKDKYLHRYRKAHSWDAMGYSITDNVNTNLSEYFNMESPYWNGFQ